VQQTAWYPTSGQVARSFQDVLIAASRSVPEQELNRLAPWDLESLSPYEPAYLAGFKAQRYQVELPDGFQEAKSVMAGVIHSDIRADICGVLRVDDVETVYTNARFRHLLLPVWLGAYRFRNKPYQVVVNARTGEVQGERPYSGAKIARAMHSARLIHIASWQTTGGRSPKSVSTSATYFSSLRATVKVSDSALFKSAATFSFWPGWANAFIARTMVAILQLAIHIYYVDQRMDNPEWPAVRKEVLDELGLGTDTLPELVDVILDRYHLKG